MVDLPASRILYQPTPSKGLGWPLMLADMGLLLMAFFALMIAQSGMRESNRADMIEKPSVLDVPKDAESLMASLRDKRIAFEPLDLDVAVIPDEPVADMVVETINESKVDRVKELFQSFNDKLTSRHFVVARSSDDIVISLGAVKNFAAGSADLDEDAQKAIQSLGVLLAGVQSEISIEGHADATPIASGRYKDNWELAAARAASVLRELSRTPGLTASSLRAVSYGDHRPVVAPTDAKSRELNRRVEIRIRPL